MEFERIYLHRVVIHLFALFVCSGGTLFTVTGSRLDLVRRPEMIVYFPGGGNVTGVRFCFRFLICTFIDAKH